MARKRKAGDGTVRQRKDGRWEGRIVIGYDDNGYPKTKNVLAKTKKECVEKLQKLKEECGGLKPEKVRSEMPFGDWLTYWYENHSKPKIRPTTQETYESRIRLHIIPEIGDIPLNKLTQNDLQQFYGRLKKSGRKRFTDKCGEGLSDRMVRMCHATCRSALEKAAQDGLIRVNPAIGCKLPPKKAREMQVLTREELQRFLIQAKFEGYYEAFLLDLATGLRRLLQCGAAGGVAHAHHPVGQPFAVLVSKALPAIFLEPTIELLQIILRQLVQRDVPDLRDDVQADAALIGFLRGGTDLGLGVILVPVCQPVPEGHLGPHLLRLQSAAFFLELLELLDALLLGFGEDIFRLGIAVVIVADDDASLPAPIFALSYGSVSGFSLSCHGFNSFPKMSSMKPPTMPEAVFCISGVTWV